MKLIFLFPFNVTLSLSENKDEYEMAWGAWEDLELCICVFSCCFLWLCLQRDLMYLIKFCIRHRN